VCSPRSIFESGQDQPKIRGCDIPKIAFISRTGLYEYTVMYLGLTKAPIYYMDLMKKDFMEYPNKIVVVFINDVLVYSMDEEEHKEHLRLVLPKLQDPRLYAKLSKRKIWIKQVSFLSHVISGEGISIDSSEIQDTLS
jgi:hypothetical protein